MTTTKLRQQHEYKYNFKNLKTKPEVKPTNEAIGKCTLNFYLFYYMYIPIFVTPPYTNVSIQTSVCVQLVNYQSHDHLLHLIFQVPHPHFVSYYHYHSVLEAHFLI